MESLEPEIAPRDRGLVSITLRAFLSPCSVKTQQDTGHKHTEAYRLEKTNTLNHTDLREA